MVAMHILLIEDDLDLGQALLQAVKDGMADAWAETEAIAKRMDTGELSSGDLFGTREYLKNNYGYRMTGAVLGIYGNSKEEAFYPGYRTDAAGRPLDGSHHYRLRIAPDQMPPAGALLTMASRSRFSYSVPLIRLFRLVT